MDPLRTVQTRAPSAPGALVPLLGLDGPELAALAEGLGLKPFQARELYRWLYARRQTDPTRWTTLPRAAREALAAGTRTGVPELLGDQRSGDGTRKLLLGLADGQAVEAVYIPDGARRTLCISSQVGCAVGCTFCLTARMGFARNLTAGEILGQVYAAEARTDLGGRPYNVVFMGMGEPLLNRAAVEKALGLMQDPDGMAISWRRITVSTSGLADALLEFARSPVCPRLALSLHAAKDELRGRLMPLNRAYPLPRLRQVLQELTHRERERVSLEYLLLGGVNDSDADARDVARFARGLKVKANLIHFNPAEGLPYRRSTEERGRAFQEILVAEGVPTSIRRSRGLDILAACGQLAKAGWRDPFPEAAP